MGACNHLNRDVAHRAGSEKDTSLLDDGMRTSMLSPDGAVVVKHDSGRVGEVPTSTEERIEGNILGIICVEARNCRIELPLLGHKLQVQWLPAAKVGLQEDSQQRLSRPGTVQCRAPKLWTALLADPCLVA